MEGLILSPVLLTPMPNAQGGTTGFKDLLTKAAQFSASSASPSQKSLESEGLQFHSLSFLGLLIIPFNHLIYVMPLIIHNYNCSISNIIAGT